MSNSEVSVKPKHVGLTCNESCERIQLVADLLLLQSNTAPHQSSSFTHHRGSLAPVAQRDDSYGKSRDIIVTNTKALAISIKELTRQLDLENFADVQRVAQKIADQVILLTEAAAQAAYLTSLTDVRCRPAEPGVINRYLFERSQQAVHMSCEKFKPTYSEILTRDEVLNISRTFADSIAVLTQGCKLASENSRVSKTDQTQFANCVQCLQGATAAFLSSLKAFASSHTEDNCKRCLLFGMPLLAAVDCTVEFASFPEYAGKPAELTERGYKSQTDILGGAMAIVGSSVQLLGTSKSLLEEGKSSSRWQKIVNCCKAVADATKLLSMSIREHTPMPSRRPSTDQNSSFY